MRTGRKKPVSALSECDGISERALGHTGSVSDDVSVATRKYDGCERRWECALEGVSSGDARDRRSESSQLPGLPANGS
jgi:hypothetical protein